jgi:hypothetical protein
MTGSAAFADVTAQDVWGAWKAQMAKAGYAMTATETMSGGTLDVRDIMMDITLPEDEGTVIVTLGEISFVDNADGTVRVELPSVLPIEFAMNSDQEGSVVANLEYRTAGMEWTVSGDPDAMTQTQTAASMTVALASLLVEGAAVDLGTMEMTMTNVNFQVATGLGSIMTQSQLGSAQTLSYLVDVADPSGSGDRVNMQGSLNELSVNANTNTPDGIDMQNFAAALKAGFGFSGSFAHGGGNSHIEIIGDGDEFRADTSSTGGSVMMSMDANRLVYNLQGKGLKVDAFTSEMPLPISFQMAETAMRLGIPLSKSDALQRVEMALTLGGFTMADMLWGLFDPTGQLPRDPATIDINLSGDVKVTADLTDEHAMAGMGDQPPGELHNAQINTLTIRAAGAELTGNGAFTFDNSDLSSFDGMPRPEGMLNLMLVGGNGLLDKLVAMGFVPEDQAMGARMMMGLFAVPGDGEDTLNSTIQVNEQGHVLANGQRLK